MTIDLPTPLILAMRAEYPGCLPDRESVAAMTEELLWAHLRNVRTARRAIQEHAPVPDEATCAGYGSV